MTTIPLEKHSDLAGVAFIRDYVEFHLDGPILRAMVDPIIKIKDRIITAADKGWRDALCGLIGKEIQAITITENKNCEICFTSGELVQVDLSTAEPESLHFLPGPNQPLEVW
jgi:hypothetical protein